MHWTTYVQGIQFGEVAMTLQPALQVDRVEAPANVCSPRSRSIAALGDALNTSQPRSSPDDPARREWSRRSPSPWPPARRRRCRPARSHRPRSPESASQCLPARPAASPVGPVHCLPSPFAGRDGCAPCWHPAQRPNTAAFPSSASISSSRLYLAMRSDRHTEPVLI